MTRPQVGRKLSYANVMSTIAVFLALAGGATAIAMSLPKNSVKSKQIAKEAVKNSDIAKDAVTGDKVKESTLGKVPSAVRADSAASADNAAHASSADIAAVANSIGSIPADSIAKEQTVSSGLFTGSLTVSVNGYGSFSLLCKAGDTLAYLYSASPLTGALETGLISAQEFPLDTPEIFTVSGTIEGASSEYGTQGKILHVQWEATAIGTNKTIVIEGGGYDPGAPGCAGQLHAYTTS
jgi:hypothetical protein